MINVTISRARVLRVTDRIVVLRNGENVGDAETKETTVREIVHLITGGDLVVEGQDFAV